MSGTYTINRSGDQADFGLTQGITRISIRMAAHRRPIAVTLWQSDNLGTRIESVMHDVAERIEVGVLVATRVGTPIADEVFVAAPNGFNDGMSLTKLFIEIEMKRFESGIVLTGRDGRELVIVAGAFPYSLAILGIGEAPHRFEPEYPLNSYKRERTEWISDVPTPAPIAEPTSESTVDPRQHSRLA